MDDKTSSRNVFLFMLLPIPFLIIGLSIKANMKKHVQTKVLQKWDFDAGRHWDWDLKGLLYWELGSGHLSPSGPSQNLCVRIRYSTCVISKVKINKISFMSFISE